MKLLLCLKCNDVIKLDTLTRSCKCGAISGRYLDDLMAEYEGDYAIPLGFDNVSLVRAIEQQPQNGCGKRFEAFVIPKECDTLRNLSDGEAKYER